MLLASLPLLYLLFTKHFKKPTSSPSFPLPPGPYQWPIIGNIFQLGTKPHITLTKFSQTYGPLFSLKLGTQLLVVASSKAAATEILRTHDRSLSGRYVPDMSPHKSLELNEFSIGWIVECNDKWRQLRSLCKRELFSAKALENNLLVREGKAREMVEFIRRREGKEVIVREVVTATVFNMLSCVLVSRDLISMEGGSCEGGMMRIAELATTPNVSDFYPVLSWFDLQGLRKKVMELHRSCFRILTEDIIEERRRMGREDSCKDFLDVLLKNGSSDDQINVLLLELLSAGTDTSSSTIEWMMAELIRNPKCMRKLEEEVSPAMDQQEMFIKESCITQLPYLEACFKETLRLHPPGPFLLPHRAIEFCQVMNHSIPKNSQILVNFWAIGRDPKYWEEPLMFNPERFLNYTCLDFKGNDFEFIPFGSGRRICPGLTMATRHVSLIVASLIHFFDWSLPHGRKNPTDIDMSEKYGLTLRKEEPLILIPRSKN
ncbi:unnamed protein product [Linum tenue]|uniref:Cytochrome P450 n=1 Tax=Linum tenue TaxID=586396 RepID=A0AAV0K0B9_9ROSI|nr:unnamed protein product [Linum tenue]